MSNKLMCAVLAHQRSGSNYLRSMLWTNPSIASYGEVLYPNFDKDGFYFYFQQQLQENWNKLLMSDPIIANEVFTNFFKYAAEKRDKPIVAFDIKLDQLYAYPILYNTFSHQNFKIVLLRRKNAIARVVSHFVMLRRFELNDFDIHYSEPKLVQVEINPEGAIKMIEGGVEFEEYIVSKFGGNPERFMEIHYEDLASKDRRDGELARFAKFLGAKPFGSESPLAPTKQGVFPLEQIVTNWTELTEAVKAAGLGWALGGK